MHYLSREKILLKKREDITFVCVTIIAFLFSPQTIEEDGFSNNGGIIQETGRDIGISVEITLWDVSAGVSGSITGGDRIGRWGIELSFFLLPYYHHYLWMGKKVATIFIVL